MVDALLGCISDGRAVTGLNGNSDARLEHIDDNQTDNQGNRGGELKPEDRFPAEPSELLEVAGTGDAHHE